MTEQKHIIWSSDPDYEDWRGDLEEQYPELSEQERMELIYNDTFNSIRPREYNGQHITFSGMNPEIQLREHQLNAVAHILYGGNTLLAHEVGAGKSATRS